MGDWAALFLFIGLDLLLLVISIVLLCGRGSWLIAGYNTASEEEKKAVQHKKTLPLHGTDYACHHLWHDGADCSDLPGGIPEALG